MNIKIQFDDLYTWDGGFGSWFISRERGVKRGTVRRIRDRLFYAYRVDSGFLCKPVVHWASVQQDYDYQELVKFRNAL